jgi:hypothetical protein
MKTFAAIALTVALATSACAQVITTPKGPKSDEINVKITKLDLLLKILPLALSKDQYRGLLISVAKARQKERELLEKEDDTLEQLDPAISAALDAALTKGAYPGHDIQDQIAGKEKDGSIRRTILIAQLTENIYNDIAKSFNTGQIKVMAGSFDDRYIDPKAKKGDLKDDLKVRFYITNVFLDPWAFDVIGTLEGIAPAEPGKPGGGG